MEITWPDCFISNNIDRKRSDAVLCADAMSAWALVINGHAQPITFGETMAKIANKLGVAGTPESFSKWAKDNGF